MDRNWIDDLINSTQPIICNNQIELELIRCLIDKSYQFQGKDAKVGLNLAACYDLLVAAQYYSFVSHTKWLYCPKSSDEESRLFFHFTNCCPRHVLGKEFYFSPANKPTSGIIGKATSYLLCHFFQTLFEKHGLKVKILEGKEPVDVIIIEEPQNKVLFAEIKASPLLTLPLSINSETLYETSEEGENKQLEHSPMNITSLYSKTIDVVIPFKSGGVWSPKYYSLGAIANENDKTWAYKGFLQLCKQSDEFVSDYFKFWHEAIRVYPTREQEPIFWLTNACGTPSPVPQNWMKRRNGSGYESVSDSKTSVGMDRTDDIKKGIFQTLKLGSLGKPLDTKWDFKIGLISNIHAARHFDDYLGSLKDIVWTLDASGEARKVADLPQDQDVYNLFDGIIALTVNLTRDKWLSKIFNF